MADADAMTPGEIARRLEDVVREVRSMSERMLLREVYDAHREALVSRVDALEQDRAKGKWLVYSLVGTFAVQLLLSALVLLTR